MRRGNLPTAVLLQHASWDPPSASFILRAATSSSSPARSSQLAVSSRHGRSRPDFDKKQSNSAHCTSSHGPICISCISLRYCSVVSGSRIASSSSSSAATIVSDFGSPLASASSLGHRTLNFHEGGHHERSLTLGDSLLITWRRVDNFSSRGLAWWSTRRWWLDSSGHGVGPRQLFCQGRAELAVMAASEAVPEGYRPNVGLCLVNEKDEVFVASRLDFPDSWQMPQGGVDDGEDPRDAAIRELREETGVTSVQLIGEVPDWLMYDFPPDVKSKIAGLWGAEWKGQAQKWFFFRFTGDESEITLVGDGSEKPEFGDWKWLPAEEVLKLVVDFKRPVYTRVFQALATNIQ